MMFSIHHLHTIVLTLSLKGIIMMNIIEPEQSRMQELATRYGMTREEMELIVYDIQQKDLTLEWMKQSRVQQIVKHRKGRWVHVSTHHLIDAIVASLVIILCTRL